MRDADLRALERSEDGEAQLRRRREEWRRDSLGAERLEVAALLGSELAIQLSELQPSETPRRLLADLLEVGPGARARTCYAAMRVVAPLWEVLRLDGRARGLLDLAGRLIAGEEGVRESFLGQAEGFSFLPGRELAARLVARSLTTGAEAILDPQADALRGEGQAFASLGWAAAALARLPIHERALVRARPGADLALSAARALRGEPPRRASTRDAFAPPDPIPGSLGSSRARRPLGSSQPRPAQERLPHSPWQEGEGGVQTLALAIARQLGPWCLDGVEPSGVSWGEVS